MLVEDKQLQTGAVIKFTKDLLLDERHYAHNFNDI